MNNPLQLDSAAETILDGLRLRVQELEDELSGSAPSGGNGTAVRRKRTESRVATAHGDASETECPPGLGTWDWDLLTNKVTWSPELYRVLELPEDVEPSLKVWERQVHPEDRERAYRLVIDKLASGTVLDTEFRIIGPNGTMRWICCMARIFRDEVGRAVRLSGMNVDLTARKQGEQRAAFLLQLEDATRPLTDPGKIVQIATTLLGDQLGVNRCGYAEVAEDQDTFDVKGDFTLDVPSTVGRYTFSQFGAECLRLLRAGQAYVVEDSESDSRTQAVRESYRRAFMRSVVCVPLHKRGRFAAGVAVHAVTPRKWRSDEIDLVRVVANRCWESMESARAKAELRSQWQTFDTLVSNVPDLMCTFDVNGRFTYANSALLQVWRRSLAEIIGKNTWDLEYPAHLANRLQSEVAAVVQTAQSVRNHTPFTSAEGETRTYEYILSPVFSWRGLVEAVTCSARDVTDHERIQRMLADSQERLRQVFQQAPVAIVVFRGRDLVIELANPYYEAMVQRKNLVGRPLAAAIPDLNRGVWDAFNQVFDSGEPFVANEWRIAFDQDGDGRPEDHWYNVVYHPLRETDNEISGVVAVCSEVTAQVIARVELEKANRELEEFAYVASHDLQEPLRMIGIYTQILLQRHLPDDPQARESGAFIKQGVLRMEQLIQDLLSYSRTIHTDTADLGVADLNESFAKALTTMENRMLESAAQVSVAALPQVRGDVTQWALVFQNLLSNSLKYRRPDVPPDIHVSAKKDGEMWVITLSDNGIGFEQQYAERIFLLFKRLHKDEFPGTGLGLAICQRIVERYGGQIWAEGRQSEGATFFISMPQA